MKNMFIISFLIVTICFGRNYTYLVKDYNQEIELESKIVTSIAKESVNDEVKIFIPNCTPIDNDIYSKVVTIVNNCKDANFVFVKYPYDFSNCDGSSKIFLTNNYKKLIHDDKYIGAFFWSKSRPNIAFIKKRLNKAHINLSNSYSQFIEE